MRTRGLDISSCQGLIDFDLLPAWVRFVVVKVSEGEAGRDPMRERNLAEARRRGLHVFVYVFLRTSQDVEKQLANLWAAVGDISPSYVFVDFETLADGITPGEGLGKALAMIKGVQAMFGRCGVYLYPWFAKGVIGLALLAAAGDELGVVALFMADYSGGENPPETWRPYVPPPWKRALFVQTSGDKSSFVPGIATHVDHDYFDGSEDELNTWLGVPTEQQSEGTRIMHPELDLAALAQNRDD